jgi:hypothetical protein
MASPSPRDGRARSHVHSCMGACVVFAYNEKSDYSLCLFGCVFVFVCVGGDGAAVTMK